MKKKFLAILLTMALVLSLVACNSTKPTENNTSANKDDSLSAVLVVIGQLGDKSFNDSANNGIKGLEAAGWNTKVIEIGRDQTKWEPTFLDLSESGEYDLIITNGPSAIETVQTVAAEYPDQNYLLFDTEMEGDHPNIYAISYEQNEGAYLAGVLAALVSTSGMEGTNPEPLIGLLGGMEHPIITDWLVGYIEGAQSVVPETKVIVSYVGSWDDTAKAKEMALAQFNQGVDVLITPAEGGALGAIDAAKETGKYIIGVDCDQSMLFQGIDEDAANCVLTSVLKNVDFSIIRGGELYKEGKLPLGTFESLGIIENGTGLAYNEYYEKNVSQDIRDKVEAAREKVESGEVVVTSALGADQAELDKIINPAIQK